MHWNWKTEFLWKRGIWEALRAIAPCVMYPGPPCGPQHKERQLATPTPPLGGNGAPPLVTRPPKSKLCIVRHHLETFLTDRPAPNCESSLGCLQASSTKMKKRQGFAKKKKISHGQHRSTTKYQHDTQASQHNRSSYVRCDVTSSHGNSPLQIAVVSSQLPAPHFKGQGDVDWRLNIRL